MGEYSSEVGKTGKLDVAADKSVKGGGRADVNTGEDGDHHTADQGCVEGIVEPCVDFGEPAAEWSGSVSGDRPECTPGGDIAACTCYDCWNEGHNQQA